MVADSLVSCVMPTTMARREWIPRAIRCFEAQDYENRELVVGSEDASVANLLPQDDRVRFILVPPGLSIGAKRNAINQQTRGQHIAHWDDDDWYAPQRLSAQARFALSGVHRMLFIDIETGCLWWYRATPGVKSVPGTSLCYVRQIWRRWPFDETVRSGEDHRWCTGHGIPITEVSSDLFVATAHQGNTSRRLFSGSNWEGALSSDLPRESVSWLADVQVDRVRDQV